LQIDHRLGRHAIGKTVGRLAVEIQAGGVPGEQYENHRGWGISRSAPPFNGLDTVFRASALRLCGAWLMIEPCGHCCVAHRCSSELARHLVAEDPRAWTLLLGRL
jgi:hypothetical protein